MRLLTIAPTGFFADYGCHVRIRGQLLALQRMGYDIQLVTYPAGRTIEELHITRAPLPFARTMPVGSSRRKLLLDAVLGPTALVAALRFRPHLVHTYLHEGALIGSAIATILHIPLTFDYQGSLTAEMIDHRFLSKQSLLLSPLRRLENYIERRPDAIYLSSDHAASHLSGHIPARRLVPLPDSVDPDRFCPQPVDPALQAHYNLNPERFTVVFLGLLAPYQGIDLLLQAIAQPILNDNAVQFLIMGFPHVEHYRRMASDLGIDDRVRFSGQIPYDQAPRHLALGDLAVAPKLSKTEGSGKLLPYMSMALPIVATDTQVHRQYLGNDAVLVKEPTPEQLAEAICGAIEDLVELRKRALRLRQRVLDHYTWDHAAQTMTGVFRQLTS